MHFPSLLTNSAPHGNMLFSRPETVQCSVSEHTNSDENAVRKQKVITCGELGYEHKWNTK